MGIAQRFPMSWGSLENLVLVFQAFHGPSFPRLSRSVRFGSLLLLLGGSAEAIGFRTGLQDVSAIGDAIQKRFAQASRSCPSKGLLSALAFGGACWTSVPTRRPGQGCHERGPEHASTRFEVLLLIASGISKQIARRASELIEFIRHCETQRNLALVSCYSKSR